MTLANILILLLIHILTVFNDLWHRMAYYVPMCCWETTHSLTPLCIRRTKSLWSDYLISLLSMFPFFLLLLSFQLPSFTPTLNQATLPTEWLL